MTTLPPDIEKRFDERFFLNEGGNGFNAALKSFIAEELTLQAREIVTILDKQKKAAYKHPLMPSKKGLEDRADGYNQGYDHALLDLSQTITKKYLS